MNYGIALLSLVPVRAQPAHKAEQVTQLLFGEMYCVLEIRDNWLLIKISYDNYEGWIHESQNSSINKTVFQKTLKSNNAIAGELVHVVIRQEKSFPVLIGSNLYEFDGINFRAGNEKLVYSGNVFSPNPELITADLIQKVACRFLQSPYQWGGRSPFGIDCSGFTQIVFKILGIPIARDAYQQAEGGSLVNFQEARTGDIVFFDNDEGKITHTGIIIGDNKIIHASGKVRIDIFDQYGIYNSEQKKYTHKLRFIKRLI